MANLRIIHFSQSLLANSGLVIQIRSQPHFSTPFLIQHIQPSRVKFTPTQSCAKFDGWSHNSSPICLYSAHSRNFTYLLTPWCRLLLEKLTGLQLVKKFPAFHGTRRFITALTSVRHLSLSWASPIQSIYPHPTFWRSILILSTHLRLGLPSGLLPSGLPTKTLYTPSPHPHAPHVQPISFLP